MPSARQIVLAVAALASLAVVWWRLFAGVARMELETGHASLGGLYRWRAVHLLIVQRVRIPKARCELGRRVHDCALAFVYCPPGNNH